VDKNDAYPKAIEGMKAKKELPEIVELRQKKYLNNIVEQDHRGIKRLTKPGMGCGLVQHRSRDNKRIRGYEHGEERTDSRSF
jgi:transposase-like protein